MQGNYFWWRVVTLWGMSTFLFSNLKTRPSVKLKQSYVEKHYPERTMYYDAIVQNLQAFSQRQKALIARKNDLFRTLSQQKAVQRETASTKNIQEMTTELKNAKTDRQQSKQWQPVRPEGQHGQPVGHDVTYDTIAESGAVQEDSSVMIGGLWPWNNKTGPVPDGPGAAPPDDKSPAYQKRTSGAHNVSVPADPSTILAEIAAVSAEINGMTSEYEKVRDIYNTGINKEWTENVQAKGVVRNMVALYRMLQDQDKNLSAARNEMSYFSKRIGFASEDEDFEAIFTSPDRPLSEVQPFSKEQRDKIEETENANVANAHTVAEAPYTMLTKASPPLMWLVKQKVNWENLSLEQRAQYERLQLLLLRRDTLSQLGGAEVDELFAALEAKQKKNTPNGLKPQEKKQFDEWKKDNKDNKEKDKDQGYRRLSDLAREMGNFNYTRDAFTKNLQQMKLDIMTWLSKENVAEFNAKKNRPELLSNVAFQEFYNRLMIANEKFKMLEVFLLNIGAGPSDTTTSRSGVDFDRVDAGTWNYLRDLLMIYTYIRDHKDLYIDGNSKFRPLVNLTKDGKPDLVPVIATPLPSADPEKGFYTRLLEMYQGAKPENRRKAAERLIDIVDSTPFLNPEVLKITLIDRLIFFILTMAIRAATLRAVSALVYHNLVRTLRGAIAVYGIIYTLLLSLLFGAVTMDDGVLRIAFNYLNSHANTSRVIVHVLVLWLLLIVSMTVLASEQGPLQGMAPVSLSSADRDDINQNVLSITFFVWLITSAQVVCM